MPNATSSRLIGGALILSAVLSTAWWLQRANTRPTPTLEPLGGPWAGELLPASTARAISLHRTTPATLTIAASNLPPGDGRVESHAVTGFETQAAKGKRPSPVWAAKLPIALPKRPAGTKGPPPGLSVTISGQPAPFARNPAAPLSPGEWRVHGGNLLIAAEAAPADVSVSLTEDRSGLDRLDRSLFKGEDAEFAHHALTLGQKTQEGLLLPAPSTVSWAVDLPQDARLTAQVAMVTSGISSDGAALVVEVTEGGPPTEAGRVEIPPTSEDFAAVDVDLKAWAGKRVTLTVRTESGATPVGDYVFVGSPAVHGRPDGDVRRVIVIGMDTTRPDHFGLHGYPKATTPELDAFGRTSIVFDNAFAPAPRTRPSFRTATTGRWPLEAVCAKNIGQTFAENGFATAGIVSNVHLTPAFDFSNGFDFWWLDGKAKANDEVDRALDWLNANQDRDSYLFLHIMDPHIFYRAPEKFNAPFLADLAEGPDPELPQMFNRWEVYQWKNRGALTEQRKAHIHALYEGEYAYTSSQMDRFFQAVDALPGKTLIVIHSDHGEEMFEHGGFEHNHTLYQEVVRALLWVRPPGGTPGGYRVDTPVTLADIGPTLYEFAGIEGPESDGRSLVPLLRGDRSDAGWGRPLPTGYLQYDRERWGVIWKGHKYILTTGSGEEELYDLSADPGEQHNLAGDTSPQPWREQLAAAHGVPVGPGYRIQVSLRGSDPVTVRLPKKATHAGVLDPESIVRNRANLEFGEKPEKTSEQVGAVTLADDGMSFTFTPGAVGEGTLIVMFDGTEPPNGLTLRRGDTDLGDASAWSDGDHSVRAEPGTIVVPPPGEHVRIEQCHGSMTAGKGSDAEMRALEALGYVGHGDEPSQKAPKAKGDGHDH